MVCGEQKSCRQYFIVNGDPIFNSPTKQLQNIKEGSYAYLWIRYTGILKRDVSNHATTLTHTSYINRCRNDPSTTTTAATTTANATSTTTTNTPPVSHKIDYALALDLKRRPRMNRMGTEEIVIHNRKQAQQLEKVLILHTAKLWGWKDDSLHSKRRMRIARAVCRQVSYDYGYKNTFSAAMLPSWESKLMNALDNGNSQQPLSPAHCGTVSYCKRIEGK